MSALNFTLIIPDIYDHDIQTSASESIAKFVKIVEQVAEYCDEYGIHLGDIKLLP